MQECYGILSQSELTETEKNGRYIFQKHNEKNILNDVIQKLSFKGDDKVLDIGCGQGTLSIPISYLVKEITCIDHENILKNIKNKQIENIIFKDGNFLEMDLNNKYDKIIIYSVLHNLNKSELFFFIDKVLQLLNTKGILLLGDIPNTDKKKRYINKYQTSDDIEQWNRLMEENKEQINKNNKFLKQIEMDNIVTFTDDSVLELIKYIRAKGFNCYLVPQISELPFNKTREDILIYNSS